jgi:hypothetical protein
MTEPIKTEWDLGADAYGRRVRLIRERKAGNVLYRIDREEMNQRDERAWIADLPRSVLEAIAGIVGDHRG